MTNLGTCLSLKTPACPRPAFQLKGLHSTRLCTKSTAPARIAIIRTRSGSDGPKNQLEKPRVFANHIIQRRAHGRSLPAPGSDVEPFCAKSCQLIYLFL